MRGGSVVQSEMRANPCSGGVHPCSISCTALLPFSDAALRPTFDALIQELLEWEVGCCSRTICPPPPRLRLRTALLTPSSFLVKATGAAPFLRHGAPSRASSGASTPTPSLAPSFGISAEDDEPRFSVLEYVCDVTAQHGWRRAPLPSAGHLLNLYIFLGQLCTWLSAPQA